MKKPSCYISLSRHIVFASLMMIFGGGAGAATFQTFMDNEPGFLTAVGPGKIVKTEDFSTATNMTPVAPAGGSPDVWNGFTVEVYGSNSPAYGGSRYCFDLGGPSCINWNASAPHIRGLYGDFNGPNLGLSIKPDNHVIAFSFDFVDWNDYGQRSEFIVIASDGSATTVTGPVNPGGAPPKKFGVTLSAADISAGRYITEIRWVGVAGNPEVVGFYNFKTVTNPVLASSISPVPSLSTWATVFLSFILFAVAIFNRRRHF